MNARRSASLRHAVFSLILVMFGLGFSVAGGILIAVAITPVPNIDSFASRQISQSTKIYDRTGQVLLYDYNRDAKREIVPISEISPNIIRAIIAIEDSSFYEHGGIRLTSIVRAMFADILEASLSQGGSTITQQVVKNTLLTNRKSIVRKLHEWILAIRLEQSYSKDQILEVYLNNIPYGGTLYGVEAASEAYFGKTAKDISIAEAAHLAAMIQAPSYYSPYGAHRAELSSRKNIILERMFSLGFLNDAEYLKAKDAGVSFSSAGQNAIIAPHFVFYILNELEEKYGPSILASGLKVTTTLDAELNTRAESIVKRHSFENEKKFKATNASLTAVDPATGQILAMVGSRDFFDKTIDGQFNATISSRQPGSAMKPFIYSLALLRGYTRNTVIFDTPTQFSTECKPSDIDNGTPPCYSPGNFDNSFRGPMTFETALAQSINVPAVKVLYLVGVQNAINFSKSFGLATLGDPNRYGLTLVLGGGEVRLLDLVGAYSVFANDGVKNTPTGILEVRDSIGNILEKYEQRPSRIIPENIARDISAMLSDAPARVPAYSLSSPLSFPGYDVAVKTGTTNDTRDAWVVGYTPSVAVGVWVGNNDNTPMEKTTAGFIAVPMWREAMEYSISKYPKTYFGEPSAIYGDVPPMLRGDWKIPDSQGNIIPHDLLYWTDKNNPRGPFPQNPERDPQFAYWEYGIASWNASHPNLFTNPPIFVPISYQTAQTSQ